MKLLRTVAVLVLTASCSVAMAVDAADRKFIREGMHEAEVLLKIGKPDHEVFIRNEKGEPEEKTWSYFPHYKDAQTLTIITMRAGVVAEVKRKIAR